jgi:protein gp37
MGSKTTIEWTDFTFNPWWGCTNVSPGCDHCYAESWARRFGVKWGPAQPRRPASERTWNEPIKWNAKAERDGVRRRVFCASMADVFDNEGDVAARQWLWEVIEETPALDWLLLTKRIGNARAMLPARWLDQPQPNVWIGATVVNQEEAERDIPKLVELPAVVRFLSCEPLLGPIDLARPGPWSTWLQPCGYYCDHDDEGGGHRPARSLIHWVICGGESGHGARPMHPDWARSLRDQCGFVDVPYFFKQWGQWQPIESVEESRTAPAGLLHYDRVHDMTYISAGKKAAGRMLDGRTWEKYPR